MSRVHDVPIPAAFPLEVASRLVGVAEPRLRRWARSGLLSPSEGSFYSFRDLVGLRTLEALRAHGIPTRRLRAFGEFLRQHRQAPWSELSYAVDGKEFVAYLDGDPVSGARVGQVVARKLVRLESVATKLEAEARKPQRRTRDQVGRIVRTRGVVGNQPRFDGTRIPVALVVARLDAGESPRAILAAYPKLKAADVEAANKLRREHAA